MPTLMVGKMVSACAWNHPKGSFPSKSQACPGAFFDLELHRKSARAHEMHACPKLSGTRLRKSRKKPHHGTELFLILRNNNYFFLLTFSFSPRPGQLLCVLFFLNRSRCVYAMESTWVPYSETLEEVWSLGVGHRQLFRGRAPSNARLLWASS